MKNTKKTSSGISFYDSLLFHAGLITLAALTFAIIMGALHTYFLTMKEEKRKVLESGREISELMTSSCSPDTLDWMLDYWQEHGEDMDILSNEELSDPDKMDEYRSFHQEAIDIFNNRLKHLTPEELGKMGREEIKNLAEVWYNNWNSLFSILCGRYELASVGVFYPEGDKTMVYFLNMPDGSNPIVPGQTLPFQPDSHPVLRRILETGSPQDDAEHIISDVDGEEYLYAAYPVILNGNIKCLTNSTFSWGDVKSRLLKEMWQMGGRTFFYVLFAVMMLLFLLDLRILKPIKVLQSQIREYSREKNSEKVRSALEKTDKRKDELGSLSRDISSLTVEIDDHCRKIYAYSEEKAAISTALSLAAKIQADALPGVYPDRKEFELHAFMKPALDVGGDFYDFYMIDDDHLALIIADVSDKGVPSTLFMMLAQTMMETLSMTSGKEVHPKELFDTINDRLKAKNAMNMFVTAWMGILTVSTGELRCANAGHEYPAICSGENDNASGESHNATGESDNSRKFRFHKVPHWPPLAAIAGMQFNGEDIHLEKGDILFVYTDGVTEAESPSGEQFGEDRILSVLDKYAGKTPREIIDGMYDSIQDFIGDNEQFDDITMLCIRYFGP